MRSVIIALLLSLPDTESSSVNAETNAVLVMASPPVSAFTVALIVRVVDAFAANAPILHSPVPSSYCALLSEV